MTSRRSRLLCVGMIPEPGPTKEARQIIHHLNSPFTIGAADMANEKKIACSFTCFPKLPGELRNAIWRESLPREPTPTLIPYQAGCWVPEGQDPDLTIRFQHQRLGPVTFELALAFVNREARGIALTWIRGRDVSFQPRPGIHAVCTRPFDPTFDALYLSPAHWDDFHAEVTNRSFGPDLLGRNFHTASSIRYVAVPESLVESKMAEIPTVASDFEQAIELLVIVNSPLGWGCAAPGEEVLSVWGFSPGQGGTFVWNRRRKRFDADGQATAARPDASGDGSASRLSTIMEASESVTQQVEGREVRDRLVVEPIVAFLK